MRKLLLFISLALLGLTAAPALAQDTAEARFAAYKHRVDLLEAQAAVENLQSMYGYYFDKGMWDDVADLFTKDGSFEYGQRGVYKGQERIRRALLLFGPQGLAPGHLNNHMQLQAVVTVADDGLSAKARWQGMIMLSEPGANGVWGVGIYENDYVKQKGVWMISKLHFYVTAQTDYDAGWLKGPIPVEGQSALLPPDAPPTEVYRSFPGAYIPPFSFPHPVTGKDLTEPKQPVDTVIGRE